MKSKKPYIKELIEAINTEKGLDFFTKKYLIENCEDLEDLYIYGEDFVQNFKWTKNEVCELLKRLDHEIIVGKILDKEDDFPPNRLLERATIQRYAELLSLKLCKKSEGEALGTWNIEKCYYKYEIKQRNLVCDLLKKLNHGKVVKKVLDLYSQPKHYKGNLLHVAVLELSKKD